MASKGNRSNALAMLLNYNNDSDNDSGYTSDEERKRKHNFVNPRESKNKKIKISEEEMLIDQSWDDKKKDFSKMFHQQNLSAKIDHSIQKSNLGQDLLSSDHDIEHYSKRLIPLPEELNLSQEHMDDVSMHQGRIRSFAHERGNWASFVFLPLTFGVFNPHLNSLLAVLKATCEDHDLKAMNCSDYHVSLSQTFILRLEWIEPFIQDLRRRITKFKKFSTWFHGLAVLSNEEKTRTFLGLKVCHGKNEMMEISEATNESLKDYRLPSLPLDRWSYHTSLLWYHGDRVKEVEKILPLLQNACHHYLDAESDMRTFHVPEIHVKTGNRIHKIPLKGS